MSKKSLKHLVCLLLGVLLVLSSATAVPTVAATDKELQNQIDELEEKSKELEAEIKALKKDKSQEQALKNALQKRFEKLGAF